MTSDIARLPTGPPPVEIPLDPARGEGASGGAVSFSEVLAALSFALDLTEGQPPGHAMRSCLIGMRIAGELGLSPETRSALYYALLLKDTGCSANSAQTAASFGSDEHIVKRNLKTTDWSSQFHVAAYAFRNAAVGCSLPERARHVLKVANQPGGARAMFRIRCERGAEISRRLGFPEETAEAVLSLDEHWDGRGYPQGLMGESIPLLARIASLAQTLEVFFTEEGPDRALQVARQRRGAWFDPELVDLVWSWRSDRDWWARIQGSSAERMVTEAEPPDSRLDLDDAGLDSVAGAFADIIDAKSPFTFRHSWGVAGYAVAIGAELGLSSAEQRRLYRAGLLHDVGKLGVSNRILDKAGSLTPHERLEVERHPVYTWQILSRVTSFREFARLAALHHERLDGNGYPWKLPAGDLDLPARILAVADVYEALTADRPYRAGMPEEQAVAILVGDAGVRLDRDAVEALRSVISTSRT